MARARLHGNGIADTKTYWRIMDRLGYSGNNNTRANLEGEWIVIYFYPGAQNAQVFVKDGRVLIPSGGNWYDFGGLVTGPGEASFIWGNDKTTKQTAVDFQPNKINWVTNNADKVKYGSMMWKRPPANNITR